MVIQIKPTINAVNVHDKGTSVPPWAPNKSDKTKWYNDGVPATGPTNGFYNIENNNHYYAQYGQNTVGWAGALFLECGISISSQTTNVDNSVHVVGVITLPRVYGYRTDHFTKGVNVVMTCHVNGVQTIHRSGLTGDIFDQVHSPTTVNFDVTIPPQGTSHAPNMTFNWVYPQHEYQDTQMVFGFDLFNPNPIPPKTYIPMAIRKGGVWKSLNDNNGMIQIRKSGTWHDISKEDYPAGEQNKGHNQIRKSGKWLKQSEY